MTVEATTITDDGAIASCAGPVDKVYTATVTFNNQQYTGTKTETLPQAAHSYGNPEWSWTGYDKASAAFTCTNCPEGTMGHAFDLEAEISAPSDTDEVITYTASVVYAGKTYTDSRKDSSKEEKTLYTVTVINGNGSDDYEAGTIVKIKAEISMDGKQFKEWTTNDGVTFADAGKAETTFTMPENNVTVTATYIINDSRTSIDPYKNSVNTQSKEVSVNPDGSKKTTERSSSIIKNPDGTTETIILKETVTTENPDGSAMKVTTESNTSVTTDSVKSADGSVTDTTQTKKIETVEEKITDADGNARSIETLIEQDKSTVVTTFENEDGTVTKKTETKESVKVTEKITDEEGRVTETVTETITESVVEMTISMDGTETGTGTTNTLVKDKDGNVLSQTIIEDEIKASADENGMKTTETRSTITTKDADGNETVESTVTTENRAADGSTGTVVQDKNGNIISQATTISQEEFDKAMEEDRPIQAPITVAPGQAFGRTETLQQPVPLVLEFPARQSFDRDGDSIVSQAERPRVEVPITYSGSGIIAMFRDASNRFFASRDCYPGSLIVPSYGSGEILIIDNTKTFKDVSENDWFYEYVIFVTAREILNEAEEGLFAPNAAINRATLAQMLFDFGPGAKAENVAIFNDVSAEDSFCGAVGWACKNGFMEGKDGSFRPLEAVSLQDMAVALWRWAGSAGYDINSDASLDDFAGADSVADYAVDAMRWAIERGLFSGMEKGMPNPTDSISRAQASSIMTFFVCNAR